MKIRFGALVTDGYGSVGGQTVSKNHYGRFLRGKVSPALVQNAYTAVRRNEFLRLSQNWKALTQDNRDLWNAATESYTFTDSMGVEYHPTGKNLYVSLNLNLFTISESETDSPPAKVLPTEDLTFTYKALTSAGAVEVTFEGMPVDTDCKMVIFGSDSISPGINYTSTVLRLVGVYVVSGGTDYDIATEYIAKFGNPTIAKKVFILAKQIHKTSGSSGVIYKLGEVVAT